MSAPHLELIEADDAGLWNAVLQECAAFDFYALPAYHRADVLPGSGRPALLVYREGAHLAALPLVLRPLSQVEGLSPAFDDAWDATSVYGYAGPVSSVGAADDPAFVERFSRALQAAFTDLKLVSVFSRLHPLLQNHHLLTLGETAVVGTTISINTSLPEEQQIAAYRKTTRHDIRKAREAGVVVVEDRAWAHLDALVELYHQTMRRVNARRAYFFDRAYFERLRAALPGILRLYVAVHEDSVMAAALITLTGRIGQYHLSGADKDAFAVTKLLLDTARRDLSTAGAVVFHLGGGVGAQKDSLHHFKRGFSDREHDFRVWRYIHDAEKYDQAVRARQQAQSAELASTFFPLYRA